MLPTAGNLPSGIAERDLEDEFIRFGTLRSVWIARKPPGFGAHRRLLPHVLGRPTGII
jgi:RNA recognition motif. (a.k.a. RRM, RBD, or RNP domain)